MPFKSKAQMNYVYANNPKLAKEFQAKTPKDADLPEKVSPKKAQLHAIKDGLKKLAHVPKDTIQKVKDRQKAYDDEQEAKHNRLEEMAEAGVPDRGDESDDLFRYRVDELNKQFDREHERRSGAKRMVMASPPKNARMAQINALKRAK